MARTRYIAIPTDRPLMTISGQKVRGPDNKLMMAVHREFVRERTTDGRYVRRGLPGILQASETRTQLDKGIKESGGLWWACDGADYKELLASINEPDPSSPAGFVTGIGLACAHCFVDDMVAIRDATFKPPEAPDSEGDTPSEPPPTEDPEENPQS